MQSRTHSISKVYQVVYGRLPLSAEVFEPKKDAVAFSDVIAGLLDNANRLVELALVSPR